MKLQIAVMLIISVFMVTVNNEVPAVIDQDTPPTESVVAPEHHLVQLRVSTRANTLK